MARHLNLATCQNAIMTLKAYYNYTANRVKACEPCSSKLLLVASSYRMNILPNFNVLSMTITMLYAAIYVPQQYLEKMCIGSK